MFEDVECQCDDAIYLAKRMKLVCPGCYSIVHRERKRRGRRKRRIRFWALLLIVAGCARFVLQAF